MKKISVFTLSIVVFCLSTNVHAKSLYGKRQKVQPTAKITKAKVETKKQKPSEFAQKFAKPSWWNDVSIEGISIQTYSDLVNYWRTPDITNQQKYKAAYQAIIQQPDNANIIVVATSLMDFDNPDYPNIKEIYTYVFSKYINYKTPSRKKNGDTIAGIAEIIITANNKNRKYNETIKVFETLITKRKNYISDDLAETLYLKYAEALIALGHTEKAVKSLNTAINDFKGGQEEKLKTILSKHSKEYRNAVAQKKALTKKAEKKSPIKKKISPKTKNKKANENTKVKSDTTLDESIDKVSKKNRETEKATETTQTKTNISTSEQETIKAQTIFPKRVSASEKVYDQRKTSSTELSNKPTGVTASTTIATPTSK